MTPFEQAFLSAVLRYVSLVHAPHGAGGDELTGLRVLLEQGDAAPDERRRHRRMFVDLAATTRDADMQAPARVLDIGAGGLRLRNDGRLPLRQGDRVVVSLTPERSSLRIDLPVEVVRSTGVDEVGVRFCGPPLSLQRSLQAAGGGGRHGTGRMGAVG